MAALSSGLRYLLDSNILIYLANRRSEAKGTPLGNNDLWIAAHALATRLILSGSSRR